jgi:hypothetical protein
MSLSSKMLPQSSRGAGAGARRLVQVLILGVVLALLAAAGTAAAQGRPKSTAKEGFNPKQHFTIVKIEPDAGAEEVRVFFSQPLLLENLQGNLRLLPRVKIDWNRTKLDTKGVLRLRGAFRYGTGYLLTLPQTLRVEQKTYHQTLNSFFMADRPPKVEFVGPQSVIERDSRQLLHVRAQNVNNLRFDGIRVPPLLLPLALAVEKSPADWDRSFAEMKTASEGLKPFVASHKDLAGFVSPPVAEKQLFPAAGEKNKPWAVTLPLSFRQGKETGALELIRVQNNEAGSVAATPPRVFEITNLGLTYKRGQQNLLLWVTSLKAGTPVPEAGVVGFTRDMEVFFLGRTNADGVLLFAPHELAGLSIKNPKNLQPVKRVVNQDDLVLLMAGTADDVAFIQVTPQAPDGLCQSGGPAGSLCPDRAQRLILCRGAGQTRSGALEDFPV